MKRVAVLTGVLATVVAIWLLRPVGPDFHRSDLPNLKAEALLRALEYAFEEYKRQHDGTAPASIHELLAKEVNSEIVRERLRELRRQPSICSYNERAAGTGVHTLGGTDWLFRCQVNAREFQLLKDGRILESKLQSP